MALTSEDRAKARNGGIGGGGGGDYDNDENDDNSSISGGSSSKVGSGGSGPGGTQGETAGVLSGHHTESRLVNCSKSVVYIILFLAAVGVSAAAYLRLVKEEETTMKTEVRSFV